MLELLQASQGKKIVLEMVNEKITAGTVLSANKLFVRLKTKEGISNIPLQSVRNVWETPKYSVAEKNIENIDKQSSDSLRPKSLPAYSAMPALRHTCIPCLTAKPWALRPPSLAVAPLNCKQSLVSSPRLPSS